MAQLINAKGIENIAYAGIAIGEYNSAPFEIRYEIKVTISIDSIEYAAEIKYSFKKVV